MEQLTHDYSYTHLAACACISRHGMTQVNVEASWPMYSVRYRALQHARAIVLVSDFRATLILSVYTLRVTATKAHRSRNSAALYNSILNTSHFQQLELLAA